MLSKEIPFVQRGRHQVLHSKHHQFDFCRHRHQPRQYKQLFHCHELQLIQLLLLGRPLPPRRHHLPHQKHLRLHPWFLQGFQIQEEDEAGFKNFLCKWAQISCYLNIISWSALTQTIPILIQCKVLQTNVRPMMESYSFLCNPKYALED